MFHTDVRTGAGLSVALLVACVSTASAAPPADSAYYTDPQSSHVEDATSRGIQQVNMITCFMAAMRPDALVNEGTYVALVDEDKCDPEGQSSSSGAGESSGAQAASYITAVVESTRTSNSDPMIVKVWFDQSEEGHTATIFVRLSATQPPSASNPYGEFRLDFCGKPEGAMECLLAGYIDANDSGLSFHQTESDGEQSETAALQLTTIGTTSGSGRMQMDEDDARSAFDFAYSSDLFRRSDGKVDQCFSRNATDPDAGLSVWSYGLYDIDTGASVTRSSGFPIEYTTDDGQTHDGYLGYWGLSLEPGVEGSLTNGDTVAKVAYSNGETPTKTNYTVVAAPGKLMKYTKRTRTLSELDQIEFTTFVGDNAASFFPGAVANTQYALQWDDAAGLFHVTGQTICDDKGCQTQSLEPARDVAESFWVPQGGVQGWSQVLGGELFIDLNGVGGVLDSAAVPVVLRAEDIVYPSELPASLYCLQDCPTAASMAAYFSENSVKPSPFVAATHNNWNETLGGGVVRYSTDASSAMLVDFADRPVAFTDAASLQRSPQFQFGVRSGRLFAALSDAECEPGSGTYCPSKVNTLDVYYQWETGAEPWNQFAAVKDAGGKFVTFDAPLQVAYEVPTGAAYGQYAGKRIVLEYGGYGDLWGLPGYCVSSLTNAEVSCDTQAARYVPSFVIPFDETTGRVTAGGTTYLVKWLDREVRFAAKDVGVCEAAGLSLPTNVSLPTAANLQDPSDPASAIYIGAKPSVNGAPRVIHGDIKF